MSKIGITSVREQETYTLVVSIPFFSSEITGLDILVWKYSDFFCLCFSHFYEYQALNLLIHTIIIYQSE